MRDVVRRRRQPGLVVQQRRLEPLVDDGQVRLVLVRRHPGGRERQLVALGDVELVGCRPSTRRRQPRPAQDQLVGAGDRGDHRLAVRWCAGVPRDGRCRSRCGRSTRAGSAPCPRTPVIRRTRSARWSPNGITSTRVTSPVSVRNVVSRIVDVVEVAAGRGVLADRAELPAAVVLGAEEGREAGGGVEARQAQPVDRPVPADQRRGVPVADQRVVLDGQGHVGEASDPALVSIADMTVSAAEVDERLRDRGATLATAESLTGGRLAALLTAVPGSSETYVGGVVSYATSVKIEVLGVPPELVEKYGVVSAECARAMADRGAPGAGSDVRREHDGRRRPRTAGRDRRRHGVRRGGRAGVGVTAVALELVGEPPGRPGPHLRGGAGGGFRDPHRGRNHVSGSVGPLILAGTRKGRAHGAVSSAPRRRAPRPADAARHDPARGVQGGAGQPRLHLRDRARPEGSLLRAARLALHGARRCRSPRCCARSPTRSRSRRPQRRPPRRSPSSRRRGDEVVASAA